MLTMYVYDKIRMPWRHWVSISKRSHAVIFHKYFHMFGLFELTSAVIYILLFIKGMNI